MLGIGVLLLGWASGTARAQECPDPAAQVVRAWELYEAAEPEAAKEALGVGYASLACTSRRVATAELLELYRLDALVSLTLDDRKSMVYASLRAVAAEPEGARPPEKYGPEIQGLYDTWSERMRQAVITLSVDGGGTVLVDGHPADALHPIRVVEGEHLVQVDASDNGLVASAVVELSQDYIVKTGVPGPTGVVPVPVPVPDPVPMPDPVPVRPRPLPIDPIEEPGRRRPLGLWLGTGATAGAAAFAIGSGFVSERGLLAAPYLANRFDGCSIDDRCYARAREDAIRTDAFRANVAYGVGYGLAAVSAGLFTVTLVGLPPKER